MCRSAPAERRCVGPGAVAEGFGRSVGRPGGKNVDSRVTAFCKTTSVPYDREFLHSPSHCVQQINPHVSPLQQTTSAMRKNIVFKRVEMTEIFSYLFMNKRVASTGRTRHHDETVVVSHIDTTTYVRTRPRRRARKLPCGKQFENGGNVGLLRCRLRRSIRRSRLARAVDRCRCRGSLGRPQGLRFPHRRGVDARRIQRTCAGGRYVGSLLCL